MGCKIRERSNGRIPTVSSEFQRRWLESLPKLLWELKHSHPNVTQAVLEMLVYIGRSSVAESTLAESYNELQPAMVPFFRTFLPVKQTNDFQCVHGPFIKLPQPCQALAIELLYFYDSFSMLLRALAQCALCSDLDITVAVRLVEVLQQAFCRGAIGLGEHLSFLFTLLAGTSSQASSIAKAFSTETDAGMTEDDEEDFNLETMRRHTALTGVICACLAQVGDGNVVLSILGPSIREELEKQTQKMRVLNGLFTAVAVLSRSCKQSGGLLLSEPMFDMLPKCIVNFLLRVEQLQNDIGASGSTKDSVLDFIKRPCIILLVRSREITLNVLKAVDEFLSTVVLPGTSNSRLRKEKVLVQIVVELIQMEKLDLRVFSDSGFTIEALFKNIEAQEDALTIEGRELRRLHEELQSSTTSLFRYELPSLI